MSIISHLATFFAGLLAGTVGLVFLFYLVILKRIRKNEETTAAKVPVAPRQIRRPKSKLALKTALSKVERELVLERESSHDKKDRKKREKRERKERDKRDERDRDEHDKETAAAAAATDAGAPKLLISVGSESRRGHSRQSSVDSVASSESGAPQSRAAARREQRDEIRRNERRSLESAMQDPPLRSGWVKIRGAMHVWWNRYVHLRKGVMAYYRNETADEAFGVVLLANCIVDYKEKTSDRKHTKTLHIVHRHDKSIFSSVGVRGRSLASMKLPGSTKSCILQFANEAESTEWLEAIRKAIEHAADGPELDPAEMMEAADDASEVSSLPSEAPSEASTPGPTPGSSRRSSVDLTSRRPEPPVAAVASDSPTPVAQPAAEAPLPPEPPTSKPPVLGGATSWHVAYKASQTSGSEPTELPVDNPATTAAAPSEAAAGQEDSSSVSGASTLSGAVSAIAAAVEPRLRLAESTGSLRSVRSLPAWPARLAESKHGRPMSLDLSASAMKIAGDELPPRAHSALGSLRPIHSADATLESAASSVGLSAPTTTESAAIDEASASVATLRSIALSPDRLASINLGSSSSSVPSGSPPDKAAAPPSRPETPPLQQGEALVVEPPPVTAAARPAPFDPQSYMEGSMDIRFAPNAGYRRLWFLANNGLLMYFESEKSSDCDGIIDLDACQIELQPGSREFRIAHPLKRSIVLHVTDPDNGDAKDKKSESAGESGHPAGQSGGQSHHPDVAAVELRCESADEAAAWVAVIRRGVDALETAEPFVLPRHVSMDGQEEKCHWFNAFMGRYFQDILHSEAVKFLCRKILQKKFDRIKKPDSLGNIEIDDLNLGNEPVSVKEICIQPTDVGNELQGEAEIVYKGGFWITIKTEFYVNFPRYRFATVPVLARVSMDFLQGRMCLYGPPDLFSRLSLSFLDMPKCSFSVKLSLGAKQYDVAKFAVVTDFIVSTLKKIIWKNLVMPNRMSFALPLPGHKLNAKTLQLTSRQKHQMKSVN